MGEFLLILWCGAIGATIGSFLNVVIYRLPRGGSLISPPSHCPRCNHKIRAYDNLPIFGWILLGGKCRDCKRPISFRYPLIEAIACVVVISFAALLLPVGQTFVRPDFATSETIATFDLAMEAGQATILPMTITQVILRIIWLSVLHLFLLTLGMVDFDRQKLKIIPLLLFLSPFLIFALFFSCLFPVPWFSIWPFEGLLAPFSPPRVPGFTMSPIFDLAFGGGTAIFLAFIGAKFISLNDRPLWFVASLAVGVFLGWQMAVLAVLLGLLLNATVLFVTKRSCAVLTLAFASFLINIGTLF